MIRTVKIVIFRPLNQSFTNISSLQKILQRFVSFLALNKLWQVLSLRLRKINFLFAALEIVTHCKLLQICYTLQSRAATCNGFRYNCNRCKKQDQLYSVLSLLALKVAERPRPF